MAVQTDPAIRNNPGMIRDSAAWRFSRGLIAHIDEALRQLEKQRVSDQSVHSARKAIKKARAALRLLRESCGEDVYRHENAALRDAGRCLSSLRNAKSMVDAFDAFRELHPAQLRSEDFEAMAMQLRATLLAKRREFLLTPYTLRACRQLLSACRARILQLKPGKRKAASVFAGLERIYRSGKKALAAAKHAGTPEALHEWRKQVKYLANALDLLDITDDRRMAGTDEWTGELADMLGEDHDLAELALNFAGNRETIDSMSPNSLIKMIERRRANLEKNAFALGAKIYGEKSAQFAARFDESLGKIKG